MPVAQDIRHGLLSTLGWRAGIAATLALLAGTPALAQQTLAANADPEFNALFQRSMQRPADVDAGLALARRAVELGDYEAAIGVYERILFYNPTLVQAKLELGRLYYRLGSYESARTYFAPIADAPGLSDQERRSIAAYLVEIDRRLSPSQWSVYAQMGLRYQSNATYGPSSGLLFGPGAGGLLPPAPAACCPRRRGRARTATPSPWPRSATSTISRTSAATSGNPGSTSITPSSSGSTG